MGKSVLTPEEDLLGKVGEPAGASRRLSELLTRQRGKGNSAQDSETGSWGTFGHFGGRRRGFEAADDGGSPG